jgi:hypothetical protein
MASMARREPYTLIHARGVTGRLQSIDANYGRLIREKVDEQLLFAPSVETRNRKPMRLPAPIGAEWEIRSGPGNRLRVLYGTNKEQRTVQILAIGERAGPVVVTRNGKAVAVIGGGRDEDEVERLLLAYSPKLQAMREKSRKQIREGDFLTHEEYWAEVESPRASKRRGRKRKPA